MQQFLYKYKEKEKMRKKILSIFLVLCMVVTLLPVGAFADSTPTSGKCGDNVTWRLDGSVLTISGKGEMYDYYYGEIPWGTIIDETGQIGEITKIVINQGVTGIGALAFFTLTDVTSVQFPNSLKYIGERAFMNCGSIKDISIPNGVNVIGNGAFYACSELETVTLPDSLERIDISTFAQCENLKSVTIPDGVTEILSYAFGDCSSLKSITIPTSVRKINNAFQDRFGNGAGLTDVYYKGSISQWKAIDISAEGVDALNNATIHYASNVLATPALKITTVSGKPQIYWDEVYGAAKYEIYRSTDGKNFKYYDRTTNTSYTNKSTTIGTTYYYKVKAVNANNATSDFSVSKSILCKPAAPSVSINRSNGKPKLSWKAVSGATKYWIYRSTDGKEFKYFDSTTKTSYTNSGATSGTKYYYRVKAVAVVNGKNVASANSSTKSLLTSLAKPSVSITTSNGKPKLTWNAVTGADKYYIYRSTDGKNFSYWDSTTKTSYVNSGAKKNTKYYYKVKAVCASNSNANSAQSSAVSIKATK